MKHRKTLGAAVLAMLAFARAAAAQTHSDAPAVFSLEIKKREFDSGLTSRPLIREKQKAKPPPPVRFHKKQFLILSVGVYAAGFADMHQTLKERKYDWWYEVDPLARPLVHLPSPAYYATGFAMATGINWISWKMGHSRRWHRFAPIPQLLAIAGNTYGYRSNLFRSTSN